ncbi:MAG: ATP-binding protein [Thermodesulfobacteriota bacterium]|nr:ATP-binding protein [Thermodesulfobacteriota bacterium]
MRLAGKTNENARPSGNAISSDEHRNGDTAHYFARLKRRTLAAMLVAFLAPLVLLSFYFHFQFHQTLKHSGQQQLLLLAESQRNTIDLFLQERVVNILNLFHDPGFTTTPSRQKMTSKLQNLKDTSDAFVDVGFFDRSGRQIGYAGPYPYLQGKDYSTEQWFQTLMQQPGDYYISDIYMGFRNKPHFTIAVRQRMEGQQWVMRATLDPDKFYLFLRTIGRKKGVNSFIINKKGEFQVVDPAYGSVLDQSAFEPPKTEGAGVVSVKTNGDTELAGYAWLKEAPWALVVKQPLRIAYAKMYTTRRFIAIGTALSALLLFALVVVVTNRLMQKAERVEASRQELKSQLFHASKLASLGELAAGVAHEINNPLAIISAQCVVIRDLFDPEYGGSADVSPALKQEVSQEIDIVDDAVSRATTVTQKLLSSARKSKATLVPSNVNTVLDNVIDGFMERELEVANINLVKDYAADMPDVLVDRDQIQQVFQNLINNAWDAIGGDGTITLKTAVNGENVTVTVTDTGCGMSHEDMGKIFLPFFTTKETGKGTGLGLAISLSIVEAMGGTINVQSMPGAGSSFIVTLPVATSHHPSPTKRGEA